MHHLLEYINQDMKRRLSKDKDSTVKLNTGAKEIQQVKPKSTERFLCVYAIELYIVRQYQNFDNVRFIQISKWIWCK